MLYADSAEKLSFRMPLWSLLAQVLVDLSDCRRESQCTLELSGFADTLTSAGASSMKDDNEERTRGNEPERFTSRAEPPGDMVHCILFLL